MKLTTNAQKVLDLGVEEASKDPDLEKFICTISSSDGFWYGLTKGGYIKASRIVTGPDLKKLSDAIKIVQMFESIWEDISYEM